MAVLRLTDGVHDGTANDRKLAYAKPTAYEAGSPGRRYHTILRATDGPHDDALLRRS